MKTYEVYLKTSRGWWLVLRTTCESQAEQKASQYASRGQQYRVVVK